MRRPCHFGVLADDRSRHGTNDPEKVALSSPTKPDEGRTVFTFPKKPVLSSCRYEILLKGNSEHWRHPVSFPGTRSKQGITATKDVTASP